MTTAMENAASSDFSSKSGKKHAPLGPAYLDHGWAPAPRYLLRRDRILQHFKDAAPGRVIEVGSASGALLSELAVMGHVCTGLEQGDAARRLARQLNGHTIDFPDRPLAEWGGAYDTLMAFEVLEHIENDAVALRDWTNWLAPGGTALLSAPAHPSNWNGRDVLAGHYRRYTRQGFIELAQSAGLEVISVECYGFPLANLLEWVRARRARQYLNQDSETIASERAANTAASGITRTLEIAFYPVISSVVGRLGLHAAIALQRLFLNTDFGNGYLLVARKPAAQ